MRTRAILGGILLGALALRLIALGDTLSHDEGYTWLVASAHSPGTFLDRLNAFENTPPLYYLLTWPFPDSGEPWLRIVAVLAGTGCVWAVWWIAGGRAGLFAAAALAVAPFAVSYSDYARGFLLADLGLLIALGAAIRGRWGLYVIGSVVALYSEYDSALFLIAIAIAFREWKAALPIALLIPWLPFTEDSETKVAPIYPNPTPASLRDTTVRLVFGEHGTGHAAGVRWIQFALVVAVCVWAFRKAPRVIGLVAAWTLALHAIVHWLGPDVFAPRYLTELIPLAAVAVGFALADAHRQVAIAGMAVLALVAVGVGVRRADGNDEPDMAGIAKLVAPAAKGRTVLTNSAAFDYYLRDLRPHLDRPFGLGPGMETTHGSFLIVDDARVAGGPRPGPGSATRFGPVYVRTTPRK